MMSETCGIAIARETLPEYALPEYEFEKGCAIATLRVSAGAPREQRKQRHPMPRCRGVLGK
jgi:hypothetical protein